ncbi:MAG: hypothetical protein ABSG95_03155 [Solirubrobacteraceae bacterium]|jgi:uncharacterized membrane protein (GlpM family)
MNRNAYTLLGYVVWHGGKWYLRRRLPSARAVALSGAAGCALLAAAVLIARRAGS